MNASEPLQSSLDRLCLENCKRTVVSRVTVLFKPCFPSAFPPGGRHGGNGLECSSCTCMLARMETFQHTRLD